jgi:hypothetical protein
MTEKLYPESVVKELLKQQIELMFDESSHQIILKGNFPNQKDSFQILKIPTPELKGGIEFPTKEEFESVFLSLLNSDEDVYQGLSDFIKSKFTPTIGKEDVK